MTHNYLISKTTLPIQSMIPVTTTSTTNHMKIFLTFFLNLLTWLLVLLLVATTIFVSNMIIVPYHYEPFTVWMICTVIVLLLLLHETLLARGLLFTIGIVGDQYIIYRVLSSDTLWFWTVELQGSNIVVAIIVFTFLIALCYKKKISNNVINAITAANQSLITSDQLETTRSKHFCFVFKSSQGDIIDDVVYIKL
jgi:hypothetical protein